MNSRCQLLLRFHVFPQLDAESLGRHLRGPQVLRHAAGALPGRRIGRLLGNLLQGACLLAVVCVPRRFSSARRSRAVSGRSESGKAC